ncbi:MAG: ribokinase [Bacteroidota bacterium]
MKPLITVIGSSNVDLIVKLPRFPKPGETVLGGQFYKAQGGKGANQAVAAARAGANVCFISRVGNDDFGKSTLLSYSKDGITIDHVSVDNTIPTGVAVIYVDAHGENTIGLAEGANATLTPEQVRRAASVISLSKLLLLQLEIPFETVKESILLARKANVPVILNPAPAQPIDSEILKNVSILTPNEIEAEFLTGISLTTDDAIKHAAQQLRSRGVHTVIITLGSRGVYVSTERENLFVPSFQVEAADTTAAGDVFNGTLAVAIAEGKKLIDAIRFANAAAALSVTKLGAQTSAPRREEIDEFLFSQ